METQELTILNKEKVVTFDNTTFSINGVCPRVDQGLALEVQVNGVTLPLNQWDSTLTDGEVHLMLRGLTELPEEPIIVITGMKPLVEPLGLDLTTPAPEPSEPEPEPEAAQEESAVTEGAPDGQVEGQG